MPDGYDQSKAYGNSSYTMNKVGTLTKREIGIYGDLRTRTAVILESDFPDVECYLDAEDGSELFKRALIID